MSVCIIDICTITRSLFNNLSSKSLAAGTSGFTVNMNMLREVWICFVSSQWASQWRAGFWFEDKYVCTIIHGTGAGFGKPLLRILLYLHVHICIYISSYYGYTLIFFKNKIPISFFSFFSFLLSLWGGYVLYCTHALPIPWAKLGLNSSNLLLILTSILQYIPMYCTWASASKSNVVKIAASRRARGVQFLPNKQSSHIFWEQKWGAAAQDRKLNKLG